MKLTSCLLELRQSQSVVSGLSQIQGGHPVDVFCCEQGPVLQKCLYVSGAAVLTADVQRGLKKLQKQKSVYYCV